MKPYLFVGLLLLICHKAEAYPEFIGYGYSSCLTCHYNGNGGGPLNDYGRALWSAEIASRWLYPASTSDEKIAEQSGFLGSTPLPFWLRPHIKYRGMKFIDNPRGTNANEKFFNMQADMGATIQDEASRYVASLTIGRVARPEDYRTGKQTIMPLMAREYFLRVQVLETWWVYAGLMEKVYGLRNVDHSSFQRTYQGFNQVINSSDGIAESLGVILQKAAPLWEVSANYFVGNPYDNARYKQSGFSAMAEVEIAEKSRIGASVYSGTSDQQKKQMVGLHYRQGLTKGSAIMFEGGFIEDTPVNSTKDTGSYFLIQSLISLTRGYNVKATIEQYNQTFKPDDPANWKWSFGFLVFPLPRFELRTEFVNIRRVTTRTSLDDEWEFLGQIHVSL